MLSNGKGFYDPIVYVLECHRLGLPLLPPSVNAPGPDFTACPLPPRRQGADFYEVWGGLPSARLSSKRYRACFCLGLPWSVPVLTP